MAEPRHQPKSCPVHVGNIRVKHGVLISALGASYQDRKSRRDLGDEGMSKVLNELNLSIRCSCLLVN